MEELRNIDIMIVGAFKAGTTSLKHYMGEHPDLVTHFPIEFFFENNKDYKEKFFKNFDTSKTQVKYVVAKYIGVYMSEDNLKILKDHNPNCKLIFIVRDPVHRAYSSFNMDRSLNNREGSFNDIVKVIEENDKGNILYKMLISAGHYAKWFKLMCQYFDRNHILVIKFEDFKNNTENVLKDIYRFSNVRNNFQPNVNQVHNKTLKTSKYYPTKIFQLLRSESNIVKKIVRAVFPYKVYLNLSIFLHKSFSSKKGYEPMDDKTEIYLRNYFKDSNLEFGLLADMNVESWLKNGNGQQKA